MPVVRIDGTVIGAGVPGPATRRLGELYRALHRDPAYPAPVVC